MRRLPTVYGKFQAVGYLDHDRGDEQVALVYGDLGTDDVLTLLPLESSADFSAALLPHLLDFGVSGAWGRCLDRFRQACREHGLGTGEKLDH
ncbi:hypothetical protein SVIOM74S_08642 [Streptomyces violarus]